MQLHERSFGGFRLYAQATNSLGRGFVEREHVLLVQNARSTELPTHFRLAYSSTPSHQPPLGKAQKL